MYQARARGQVRDTYTEDRNWITVRMVRIAAYRHWQRVEGIKEDDGYIRLPASPPTENIQSFATLSTVIIKIFTMESGRDCVRRGASVAIGDSKTTIECLAGEALDQFRLAKWYY